MMKTSLTALCATVACLVAAPAAMATKYAPPGNSAISEYIENVPGAKGNVPSTSVHSHGSAGSGVLSASTQHALAQKGSDGAQVAALAAATAPAAAVHRHATGPSHSHSNSHNGAAAPAGGSAGGPPAPPVTGSVNSSSQSVLKAVTGSATHGLGALLPVILVLSAIGAAALSVLRHRRSA
jgi:hypothetical protein